MFAQNHPHAINSFTWVRELGPFTTLVQRLDYFHLCCARHIAHQPNLTTANGRSGTTQFHDWNPWNLQDESAVNMHCKAEIQHVVDLCGSSWWTAVSMMLECLHSKPNLLVEKLVQKQHGDERMIAGMITGMMSEQQTPTQIMHTALLLLLSVWWRCVMQTGHPQASS